MKTLLLTLTYIIGSGELILAIYFWITNSKNEIRRVMALLAFSTGMWVITSAIVAYKSTSQINNFINALVFCFGVILITALIHLFLIYPYRILKIDWLHIVLLYFPALIFSASALFTKSIASGSTGGLINVGSVIPCRLYPVYNIILFLIFIIAILLAIYRYKKSDGSNKKNLSIIISSIIIGAIPAVYYDLLNYFINPEMRGNSLWGNIGTIIWVGVTAFIIYK